MKKKQNSFGRLIDLLIVVVYGELTFILFVNQFFQKQELLNFTIVATIAFIGFILYKIWFYTDIRLSIKDRYSLGFLISYFKESEQKSNLFELLYPYFFGYSESQIKNIIKIQSKKKTLLVFYKNRFRRKSKAYKMYLVYILLSHNYQDNKNEILKKYVEILFPNSYVQKQVDYYLFSHRKSGTIKRRMLTVWDLYKTVGLFPKTKIVKLKKGFFKLRKSTNLEKEDITENEAIRMLTKYQDANEFAIRRFRNNLLWINLGALIILSGVFIFLNNPLVYFIMLPIVFISGINYFYGDANDFEDFFKKDRTFLISNFKTLLLTELTVHFLYDRYNVDENNISKYLRSFVLSPYEHEVQNIVKEQKSLKDICFQIYNSGYESSDFIKHLFEVAAADKIFSDGEDTYIKRVAEYLEIEKEDTKIIRDRFLARGVKEQKAEYKKYKNTSSFSSSVYTFYSSKAYKILGIDKTASAEEIKKAYRTLVKKNHPDIFATQGKDAMEQAEDRFQIITEAYELIKRLRGIN